MDADICVILNPGSGKATGQERQDALEAEFAAAGRHAVIRQVPKGGDIVEATGTAVKAGFPTIVAAGGDGTVSAVAGRLSGTDIAMGVIPYGTFNYFARTLGIPIDLHDAVRVITAGQTRRFDLGEVNDAIFLNNASLGAYPAILDERERIYARLGRSRLIAYWSMLTTLLSFRRPLRLTLTVDGTERTVRTPLVFIAKNAGQLESLDLDGADCVRDGQFAVFVARETGRFGLVLYAARLALRLAEPREDFELICGREVTVVPQRPCRIVARDGELERMRGPYRFRLRPDALKVLVAGT